MLEENERLLEENDRLLDAKRRALKVADERSKENVALRALTQSRSTTN
jgi:hypothetical protein